MIYNSISDLIGSTPLVKMDFLCTKAEIIGKAEFFNPAGSAKDRIAKAMIMDAKERGILKSSSTVIEPTSGNTGIGLASICAAMGYKIILTMPETMSIERRNLLKAYGAEIVLTEGSKGMAGAIAKAEELQKTTENSFIPGQFDNSKNPEIHYLTTGPEIWAEMNGDIDFLVAGIGTGGTVSGTGKFLKEKNPNIKIIGVEPADSPFITKGVAGPHKIQGIGAGFIPENLDTDLLDEVITVKNEDAFKTGKNIARNGGFLVGISSGAAAFAAMEIANRSENTGKKIVVILPDTGERYLSTTMFD